MKLFNNSENKMTHSEIESAMNKFLSQGGKVNKLPNQAITVTPIVGEDKWGQYESLESLKQLTI